MRLLLLSSWLSLALVGASLLSGCAAATQQLSPSLKMVQSLPEAGGASSASAELSAPVVMVHFFASWCTLCAFEFPHLAALRASIPQEQLGIVAIAIDDNEEDVRHMLAKRQLPFAVLVDAGNGAKTAFAVSDLPTTVFVTTDGKPFEIREAKSGKPLSRFEGAYEWDRGDALAALEQALSTR